MYLVLLMLFWIDMISKQFVSICKLPLNEFKLVKFDIPAGINVSNVKAQVMRRTPPRQNFQNIAKKSYSVSRTGFFCFKNFQFSVLAVKMLPDVKVLDCFITSLS